MDINLLDIFLIIAIIILIGLIFVFVFIHKVNSNIKDLEKEKDADELPEIDLAELANKIDTTKEYNPTVDLTKYEEEQEAKAIISYDELVKTQVIPNISYTQEINLDGLSVKTVDVNNLGEQVNLDNIKEDIKSDESKNEEKEEVVEDKKSVLIRYDKEEAFLDTLKKIQKMLD